MQLEHLHYSEAPEETTVNQTPVINAAISKRLLENRKVFLWGAVEDESARTVVSQLVYLATESSEPIHLYINSPGGMVTAGNAILDIMHSIKAPVYTYCLGFAASMGAILLSAGEKGHRYIYPSAEVMIHQPGMGGVRGRAWEIETHARQIAKAKQLAAALLAKNCNRSLQQVLDDFDKDYWMDADEAIKYGIVDRLVTD